jgi:hypothetical protein
VLVLPLAGRWADNNCNSDSFWRSDPLGRWGAPRGRDQIREQDATGQSRINRDGCDVDAASIATKGDGGDASDGLRPGSLCS